MAKAEATLYLATPRLVDAADADALHDVAGRADLACVLVRLAAEPDARLQQAVARLRQLAQARDAAVVMDGRSDAAADGVQVAAVGDYAAARRAVGAGAIVGVACATRHEAMEAAEQGADYILFGDPDDPAPGERTLALVEWWASLMTVPCVAAGAATPDDVARLRAAGADFVMVGPELAA